MRDLAQVWSYRNLIWHLAQRDLRSRYKRSVLGWLWSLINPAATLAIFSVVFGSILRVMPPEMANGMQVFALFLFSGLVVWNLFNSTVNGSMTALQGAGPLLSKVYFPPACPAIAHTITVIIQALLEFAILAAVMLVVGNLGWQVIALPVLIVFVVLFSLGVGLVVSIYNVFFRDVTYLLTIALQALFYATPIIYTVDMVPDRLGFVPVRALVELNPLTHMVNFSRDIFYLQQLPSLRTVGALAVSSLAVFAAGWWVFNRRAELVTEEL